MRGSEFEPLCQLFLWLKFRRT